MLKIVVEKVQITFCNVRIENNKYYVSRQTFNNFHYRDNV